MIMSASKLSRSTARLPDLILYAKVMHVLLNSSQTRFFTVHTSLQFCDQTNLSYQPTQVTTDQSFSAKKNDLRTELPRYESAQVRFYKMIKKGCGAGEDHIAACNLTRTCSVRVHTKSASEGKSSDLGGLDLLLMKVDIGYWHKQKWHERLNYDEEHIKLETKHDHGHKLNKVNQKQNFKAQDGYRTGDMWRCTFLAFFVDSR